MLVWLGAAILQKRHIATWCLHVELDIGWYMQVINITQFHTRKVDGRGSGGVWTPKKIIYYVNKIILLPVLFFLRCSWTSVPGHIHGVLDLTVKGLVLEVLKLWHLI